MCFELYVHSTTPGHDTRFPCVLNLRTGYTVYSPFQEPNYNPLCRTLMGPRRCGYPHVPEHLICKFKGAETCKTRVKYHHFVNEESGENSDTLFLSMYLGNNPSLLYLVAFCFKAGVDYALADMARDRITARLALSIGNNNGPNAAEQVELEFEYNRLSKILAASAEVIGQFARLWDYNTGPGVLPSRPGSRVNPYENVAIAKQLNLKVKGWLELDRSANPWPSLVQLQPQFQTGRIAISDDPSIVSRGAAAGNDQGVLDPIFPSFNLNPDSEVAQTLPQVGFNPNPTSILEPAERLANTPALPSPPSLHHQSASSTDSPLSSLPTTESEPDSDYFDEEHQEGIQYQIEAIVNHHPRGVSRRRVTSFKVRWEGQWPKDKKGTWELTDDIDPAAIEKYWEWYDAKTAKRVQTLRRRHIRQQKGIY